MKLLLDISVIIDFLRKRNKNETLFARLIAPKHEFYMSILTYAELFSGKSVWENKALLNDLNELCSDFHIQSIDRTVAQKAGAIRAHLHTDLIDSIIAATAIENRCELVTLNVKDFAKIPHLKLFSE